MSIIDSNAILGFRLMSSIVNEEASKLSKIDGCDLAKLYDSVDWS